MRGWQPESLDHAPGELYLTQWAVYELTNAYGDGGVSRHLVGTDPYGLDAAVSDRIEFWDVVSMRGLSMTGLLYQLVGHPGLNPLALGAWEACCADSSAKDIRDVTNAIWEESANGGVGGVGGLQSC